MARISQQEQAYHERLRAASERNIITFHSDFDHLNRPSSPVFDPWESVGPLLGLLIISVTVMLFGGLIPGVVILVISVILYVVGIRPWVATRLHKRVVVMALHGPRHFQALWDFGGVAITLTDRPQYGVSAPKGNWRMFIKRSLPGGGAYTAMDEELAGASFDDEPPPDRREGGKR